MSFNDLAKTRRSVRRYADTPVRHDLIEACIEAARIAPSASNSQPWHYVVVEDEKTRKAVGNATLLGPSKMNRFVSTAPVIIVLIADRTGAPVAIGRRIKRLDYPLIDVGISASHFCLQAAELGLGTCMIGWFNSRRIRRAVKIPGNRRIALVITLGYPADQPLSPKEKRRKTRKDITSYEVYRA